MHRKVRRFGMEGTIADDAMFTTTKEHQIKLIVDDMRERGYVPVLNMGPYFATSYDMEKQHYHFVVTAYGVFVGERKAWKIEGIDVDSGTLFPKSTPQSKSKPPSTPAE